MRLTLRSILASTSIELLAALVLLLVAVSFVDMKTIYGLVVALLFAAVFLTAVRVMTGEFQLRIIAYGLAAVWLALSPLGVVTQSDTLRVTTGLLFVAFGFFCIGVILRRIVAAKTVDTEVVFYSVSVYLLVALAWAVSYEVIYMLWPGSFKVAESGSALTLSHFVYFSLTTITTLGYGDIAPAAVAVGIWSTLEVATGVFYIAILVARLVSMYR